MTSSPNPASASISILPAAANVKKTAAFPETPNHLKRDYAWQVATNLVVSFRYAWAGVTYAFSTQRNFRIHTLITLVATSLGLYLQVTPVGMSVLILTCALVMVLELLNTALESVVDLTVGQSYHELAKIAKDCAAGAVLISALAAIGVACFIILPPLYAITF
ncbi:MAG: diacylglycerol kinase family protein [Chlorogloea purpurea SAG 13.99]|nr:diacylglycerol kinase family protein [Chlorogloea purpurea SAG 13.99]